MRPPWKRIRPADSSSRTAAGGTLARRPSRSRTRFPTSSAGSERTISRASSIAACQRAEMSAALGTGPSKSRLSISPLHVPCSSALLDDAGGREARILSRGGPGEIAEPLDLVMALHGVDPVARLPSPDEREQLVRGEVERVKDETEGVVLDEREEAESTVSRPLNEHGLARVAHARLDERRQLPDGLDAEPGGLEGAPVGRPGRHQRFFGVVKQVHVAGSASAGHDLVQGRGPCDVALAAELAVRR